MSVQNLNLIHTTWWWQRKKKWITTTDFNIYTKQNFYLSNLLIWTVVKQLQTAMKQFFVPPLQQEWVS